MARAPSPDLINAALKELREAQVRPTAGSRLEYFHLPLNHARTLLRVAKHGVGKADLLFAVDGADARGDAACRLTAEARTALLAQLGAAA